MTVQTDELAEAWADYTAAVNALIDAFMDVVTDLEKAEVNP